MNWIRSKFGGGTKSVDAQEMKDLAKYVKDPKLFEEYSRMRNNPDDA